MSTVWIPPLLRSLTGGQETVQVPGSTVAQIVDELERRYPGMKARLCDGDQLRPGLAVAVNGQVGTLGVYQSVQPDSEVHFLPAVSGG
jgi:molybdopterin synthase sulfur carrier subunit